MKSSYTRAQMETILRRGGSFFHDGRLIVKEIDLPSEAELAEGDPEAEAAAQVELERRIADLQAQVDKLQTGSKAKPKTEPKDGGTAGSKASDKDAG